MTNAFPLAGTASLRVSRRTPNPQDRHTRADGAGTVPGEALDAQRPQNHVQSTASTGSVCTSLSLGRLALELLIVESTARLAPRDIPLCDVYPCLQDVCNQSSDEAIEEAGLGEGEPEPLDAGDLLAHLGLSGD